MSDIAEELRQLREKFLEHAGKEEQFMQTIETSVEKLSRVGQESSTANLRLADAVTARLQFDREKEAKRDKALEVERHDANKNKSWWRSQWDKYGLVVIVVACAVVYPSVLPTVLNALGLSAPQRVVVEQPAPAPLPTPEPPVLEP